MGKKSFLALLVILGIVGHFLALSFAWYGEDEYVGSPFSTDVNVTRITHQEEILEVMGRSHNLSGEPTQILFGDLQVQSSFSRDALLQKVGYAQLSTNTGSIAQACDYARFCSAVDFFAVADDAASLTPDAWEMSARAVSQCNQHAQIHEEGMRDTQAFLGFVWSQGSKEGITHYGDRTVIFPDEDLDSQGTFPVAAYDEWRQEVSWSGNNVRDWFLDPPARDRNQSIWRRIKQMSAQSTCTLLERVNGDSGCRVLASTPSGLIDALETMDTSPLLFASDSTLGTDTPRDFSWSRVVEGGAYHPEYERLFSVYSGRGSTELWRGWNAVSKAERIGEMSCPEPNGGYVPACWRAGEISSQRCIAEGHSADYCDDVAERSRRLHANHSTHAHLILGNIDADEWEDAGQCTDCFLPTFNYRPGGSLQHALGLGTRNGAVHFGVVGGSADTSARPGIGYKEINRLDTVSARRRISAMVDTALNPWGETSAPLFASELDESLPLPYEYGFRPRQSSYAYAGGLTAVHATSRDRADLWKGLQERSTYATSGARILLWFHVINANEGVIGMGASGSMDRVPSFQVTAVGSRRQASGCPEVVSESNPARLEEIRASLCKNECFNPQAERHRIERIQVVRITPAQDGGVQNAIEDPWLDIICDDDGQGCHVSFQDPQFLLYRGNVSYYVRAIQEPTPTMSGEPVSCVRDRNGRCTSTNFCRDGYHGDATNLDCFAMQGERAWSSPIFLRTESSLEDYQPVAN